MFEKRYPVYDGSEVKTQFYHGKQEQVAAQIMGQRELPASVEHLPDTFTMDPEVYGPGVVQAAGVTMNEGVECGGYTDWNEKTGTFIHSPVLEGAQDNVKVLNFRKLLFGSPPLLKFHTHPPLPAGEKASVMDSVFSPTDMALRANMPRGGLIDMVVNLGGRFSIGLIVPTAESRNKPGIGVIDLIKRFMNGDIEPSPSNDLRTTAEVLSKHGLGLYIFEPEDSDPSTWGLEAGIAFTRVKTYGEEDSKPVHPRPGGVGKHPRNQIDRI